MTDKEKSDRRWLSLPYEKLIEHITNEARMLQYLKNCSDNRDPTDYEIKEWEICHRMLTNATDAIRIKFSY